MESSLLEGKVGRIYVPSQDVDHMALAKPKGTKRQRQEVRMGFENSALGGGGVQWEWVICLFWICSLQMICKTLIASNNMNVRLPVSFQQKGNWGALSDAN